MRLGPQPIPEQQQYPRQAGPQPMRSGPAASTPFLTGRQAQHSPPSTPTTSLPSWDQQALTTNFNTMTFQPPLPQN